MRGNKQNWKLWVVCLLAALPGCGVSQNPSYFPWLFPTGNITRTHAKPPGKAYFRNFDPHAVRLEVRPIESTNPVQTQHVVIATIYDKTGKPRRRRRVEWMLEGVGNIVEVDESGYFAGRGYKVDNHYAVSYTDYKEHIVTRGNDNPNDDFVIRPGQTWCVISSAVEGDSYLTVYAPEIHNWEKHKVFVKKHWVDAEWSLPPPAVNRVGTEHVFVTRIFRHTDRQPLANYKVRYKILDGPPAVFLPNRTQEAVVISDLDGNASVVLAQVERRPGINRIGIEIIRPPDPRSATGSGIVIGTGETTKEWQAPTVGITKTGPASVSVGQEVPYNIVVDNNGQVEVQAVTVRDNIPEGLQYLRSEPPATVEGRVLTWTMGALPPGQAHTIQVIFRAERPGQVQNCATATTDEGFTAESCATTVITAPQLTVNKTGPATGIVGMPITYQITVSNPGNGPATNVVLNDSFDPGLEHESRANPVELRLGTLNPGETRTVPLVLTPRREGRFVNRVTATADGGLTAQDDHPVVVQRAQLSIDKTGPGARYVGRPAVWDIRVSNPGAVPLNNVVVRDQLPPELQFESATQGGQLVGGEVVWNLGTLQPNEQRQLQVTTRCRQMSPRALNVAVASADPGLEVQAEAAIEILGLPAYRLEVLDVDDAVEVGGKTTYRIDVNNQGSLPGSQVQVIAIVPPQMRIVRTNGPTQARVDGQRVIFEPVESLAPQQTLSYTIDVEALQPGDVRFRVELRSATLQQPVIEEESTTIYMPRPGAGRTTRRTPPAPIGPGAPNP
ncbi:MAG: hypothetical protein KatS3mg105_3341 [Gemmatales bacterium]|nr:MAG: hypothetical protein KatS3mg105_3341 [Gemmatales bacterium]